MKRLWPFLAVVAAIVVLVGAYFAFRKEERREKAAPAPPAPLSFELPNGLAVELVPAECGERVGVALLFAVGANHDPKGRSGMSEVVERILAAAAPAEAKVAGGSDHTVYSVVVSGDKLLDQLDALAALMKHLDLRDGALDAARMAVLADIKARSSGDAALTASTYAVESVQPSRGGGRRGGVASEVEAIDSGEVEVFWGAHFTAKNARIAVVGKIDADAVRARIEASFGALPAGEPPVLRPPGESTVIGNLVMGDAPAAVALAVPAPQPSDPLFPAFLVLAARLTGDAPAGQIWSASYDPLFLYETLFVAAALPPGQAPEPTAVDIRKQVGERVGAALDPADVAAARKRFGPLLGIDDAKACSEDPGPFAMARARRAQLGLDELDLATALDGVSQAALTEAAALFEAKRTTVVIAGGKIE